LEIRLQSESFDTLDDLVGFRVQTLRSKAVVPKGNSGGVKQKWAVGGDRIPT